MRFHVLAVPHTITTPEYSSCAFTQKIVKLCKMLIMEGHEVIHYGHEASVIHCTEHVTVTDDLALEASYPKHNWRKSGWPKFKVTDFVYTAFYAATIREIGRRKQPGDFLLCPFGAAHKPIADAHPDLIAVESGIGYPNGVWAKYRVFESYAIMHAYQGNRAAETSSNSFWYDVVIPNAFDLDDFEFSVEKDDYFLFLGRVSEAKGVHIARDLAGRTRTKLIVAGQGDIADTPYVQHVGVVGPDERKRLLSRAKGVICASTFLEPFCGVQIEAMISGTPVISTDWGAFAEYNRHCITGYRCKTFEQFEWAAKHLDDIDPMVCREWGMNFALENIAPKYTDYFQSVKDIYGGRGFYEPRDDRRTLMHSSF
jgi:glycosyltransferase involved in cell wall biosynthesis